MSARDYDVVVVGGGGAAHAAAISAREAGASSVLMIEAGKKIGGSSALSGGVIYAAGTSVQRAAGIQDHPDGMYEYYMTLGHWANEPWIIRRLADESAPTIEWLIGHGVEYKPEKLYCAGVESVPRGHMTEGAGYALVQCLNNVAGAKGVETIVDTRVTQLVRDPSGRVIGVRAGDAEVRGGAIVLACGGIGGNKEMVREYFPAMYQHGDWMSYIGGPHNQGDAIVMGKAIGASVTGANRGSATLTPNFSPKPDGYLPGWLVIVNHDGRRFMDETCPYTVVDGLVNRQPQARAFAIIDEAARQAATPDAGVTDPLGLGDGVAYNWTSDMIAKQAAAGRIITASTLDDLAMRAGIRPGTFRTTIANYNRDVDRDFDSRFLKAARPLRKVEKPPFYAVELRAANYAITGAGLRIDDEACVLDEDDAPIAGMFAAGESAGGIYGDRYYAGGSSLGAAVVWGRIAGRNAAACAAGNPFVRRT